MELIDRYKLLDELGESASYHAESGREYQLLLRDRNITREQHTVIEIPDGATNGDMIKAIFSKIKIDPIRNIAHFDDNLENMSFIKFDDDWWNAKY